MPESPGWPVAIPRPQGKRFRVERRGGDEEAKGKSHGDEAKLPKRESSPRRRLCKIAWRTVPSLLRSHDTVGRARFAGGKRLPSLRAPNRRGCLRATGNPGPRAFRGGKYIVAGVAF